MNSYLVYRASFYLMLFVATMSLSGDTPDGQFARLLGLIAAGAGAVAFYAVDRTQMLAAAATAGQSPGRRHAWPYSISNTGSTRPSGFPPLHIGSCICN